MIGRRLILGLLALSAGGGAAAAMNAGGGAAAALAAHGPTVAVNRGCYQLAQRAVLQGSGFDAGANWSATLDGAKFGHGTTTAKGAIRATFGAPSHLRRGSSGEDAHRLVVHQGIHTAAVTFLVTELSARFTPTSGDPTRLKVRFRLLGWGHGGALFLHYLNANGTDRFDRFLGRPQGACGDHDIPHVKLFPFTPKKGVWTLQFDKSTNYQATSVPRVIINYRIS